MSWIEDFLTYTSNRPSPPLFRKWAAISAVAGVLERKVWVRSFNTDLHPNLYVLLVGPPAVGKTVMISEVDRLWISLRNDQTPSTGHYVASTDLTGAAIIDELHEAQRRIIKPEQIPSVISFNSLLVASNELGTLIPAYEPAMMNFLTDVYDGKRYDQKRRGRRDEPIRIPNPQLNLLAGTTPSYLNNFMPEGAWDQGFISRVIIIYSGDNMMRNPFIEIDEDGGWKELQRGLAKIGSYFGRFTLTSETKEAFIAWHMGGGKPVPNHPRLLHYNGRRSAHLLKLCMIASADRTDKLVVEMDDYHAALSWLLDAELYMPEVFKSMNSGGDKRVIEETYHWMLEKYLRERKPIIAHMVYEFVSQRTPAHNVGKIVQVMVQAGIIEELLEKVGKCFKPKGKLT